MNHEDCLDRVQVFSPSNGQTSRIDAPTAETFSPLQRLPITHKAIILVRNPEGLKKLGAPGESGNLGVKVPCPARWR